MKTLMGAGLQSGCCLKASVCCQLQRIRIGALDTTKHRSHTTHTHTLLQQRQDWKDTVWKTILHVVNNKRCWKAGRWDVRMHEIRDGAQDGSRCNMWSGGALQKRRGTQERCKVSEWVNGDILLAWGHLLVPFTPFSPSPSQRDTEREGGGGWWA